MHSNRVCLNLCRGLVGWSEPPPSLLVHISAGRHRLISVSNSGGQAGASPSSRGDSSASRPRRRYVLIVQVAPCDAAGDRSHFSCVCAESCIYTNSPESPRSPPPPPPPGQVKKQLPYLLAVSGSFSYSWNMMKRRGESRRDAPSAQEPTQRWQLRTPSRR